MNGHKLADWISLNLLNTVFLLKEWVLIQLGIQVSASSFMDKFIAWGVGGTIIAFNVVRIWKYLIDIKQTKKESEDE